MSVEPIKPKDAQDAKVASIPDVVFESFNTLIARNLSTNGRSIVTKKDVIELIGASSTLTSTELYNKNYLDIEYFYRKAGWKVGYESPDRGEDYESYYTFSSRESTSFGHRDGD